MCYTILCFLRGLSFKSDISACIIFKVNNGKRIIPDFFLWYYRVENFFNFFLQYVIVMPLAKIYLYFFIQKGEWCSLRQKNTYSNENLKELLPFPGSVKRCLFCCVHLQCRDFLPTSCPTHPL